MMVMMADQLLAIMYSIKYPVHVHGTSFLSLSLSLSDGGSPNTYPSGKGKKEGIEAWHSELIFKRDSVTLVDGWRDTVQPDTDSRDMSFLRPFKI